MIDYNLAKGGRKGEKESPPAVGEALNSFIKGGKSEAFREQKKKDSLFFIRRREREKKGEKKKIRCCSGSREGSLRRSSTEEREITRHSGRRDSTSYYSSR